MLWNNLIILRSDIYVNSSSLQSVLNIAASDIRKWQPTLLVFLSGKCRGQRSWWATVHGVAKSQARLSTRVSRQWHKVENALSLPVTLYWLPPWRRSLSLCYRWQVSAYVTRPGCFVPHFLPLSSGSLSFNHVASILSCWLYGLLGLIFYIYEACCLVSFWYFFLSQLLEVFSEHPVWNCMPSCSLSLLFLFPALFFSQALITFSFTIWYSVH